MCVYTLTEGGVCVQTGKHVCACMCVFECVCVSVCVRAFSPNTLSTLVAGIGLGAAAFSEELSLKPNGTGWHSVESHLCSF